MLPGTGFQFSFIRKNVKLLQHLEELLLGKMRGGGHPGLFSNRIFNAGRGRWLLESLEGAFGGRRRGPLLLMLLVDILDEQGVHNLPLPVLSGCQLRIIQQLVNHGQVMFFTLSK